MDDDFEIVKNKVLKGVNGESERQYDRITVDVVRKAVNLLKPKKSDAGFDISSDFYLNGPTELIHHLTNLLKLFFSHGYVPQVVLICTLIPLLKDNLGDITTSSNYRAIAGGCLLLKLIDLVIIVLEGDKLDYDTMQFAYQTKSSTTMCSWSVAAVIEHFNNKGTNVFSASMDMSKAFDMVEWRELFTVLMDRKVDSLFLRLLLFIYTNQQCNVKWCGRYSNSFTVQNGVRQGAVTSGIFFAVYIDKLLKILRKSGLGCRIHGVFFGALIFADDIILLSGSRNGLQAMVDICYQFASSRNLKFGTNTDPRKSKTKCVLFNQRKINTNEVAPIKLGGNVLPWVQDVKHLGHVLQADNSMKLDISQKRGAFVGRVNSLLQEFHSVKQDVMIKLIKSFACSVYGSNLWDLFSHECERLYTSYNVAIRNALDIDRCAHRYLVEPLSETLHLKIMILSRYVTFYKSLKESKKFPVRFLARLNENDRETVLGRNLANIALLCNVRNTFELNPKMVKDTVKYRTIPDKERWRVNFAWELLKVREEDVAVNGFDEDELETLLTYICKM